jgi:hypothetical protein
MIFPPYWALPIFSWNLQALAPSHLCQTGVGAKLGECPKKYARPKNGGGQKI